MAASTLHLRALRRAASRPRNWLIAVPTAVLIGAVGAPFVYTQVILGPPRAPLSFDDLPEESVAADAEPQRTAAPSATPGPSAIVRTAAPSDPVVATASPIEGRWTVGSGSQAGYSVDDTVMGQTTRVVGRTSYVAGDATVVGLRGMTAAIDVDMATVLCNCPHDEKYRELLEVEKYPSARFELTEPIAVRNIPPEGTVVTLTVNGRFTIHGVTRDVTFPLRVTQKGERIAVNGSIPVDLADYNIENPNNAFGSVSNAAIDLLLAFDRVG